MSVENSFPTIPAQGPDFIDTGVCHCAMRHGNTSSGAAWRCLGNRTADIYEGISGKWFLPRDESDVAIAVHDLPQRSNRYPPNNLTTSFVRAHSDDDYDYEDPGTWPNLVPIDDVEHNPFTIYDNACTGVNNSILSAHYYASQRQEEKGQTPTDSAVCLQANMLPLTIQIASSFAKNGCYPGFFCSNNSVNALPQFCVPVEECQASRLAGVNCPIAMGVFEPLLCPPGSYCPVGGKELLTCPAGSYCPPGTVTPIRCTAGSNCSEGSYKEMNFLATGILLISDSIIFAVELVLFLRRRLWKTRQTRRPTKKAGLRRAATLLELREWRAGYATLPDERDMETIDIEPNIHSVRRVPTGFQAALDAELLRKYSNDDDGDTFRLKEFIKSCSKCNEGSQFGLSFAFTNLSYHPKGVDKPVLSEVTGNIPSGALVGIMGGSGAGKTSFVNVLMGKVSHTGGVVSVNGDVGKIAKYKKAIGYVPQDDIILPELTVRENILFSARVRLPAGWTDHEVQTHVDALIDCLELGHVRNSLVGSPARPVISGGQRKRVSIGVELANAPKVLFLDEPTSGLDATSAGSIMKILKALSQIGITVVTVIHQPREEIFEMIDDLILFADGQVIYQGKEQEVKPYFERIGFHFPPANAADVVMDIITGQGRPYKSTGEFSKAALIQHWRSVRGNLSPPPDATPAVEELSMLQKSVKRRGARWYRQLYLCLFRSILQQYRLKSSFWFEMGAASLGGFLCGLAQNAKDGVMFHGLFNDDYAMLSSAVDFSSILIMAMLSALSVGLIASSPGVKHFGEEKLLYFREAAVGHNRFSYYIGKTVATLPRIFFGCLHFSTLFILLSTPQFSWGLAFAVNLLYYYCIYGLATCVSMVTRREDGPLIATMMSLIVGILSGMAPRLSQVKQWHLGWLWNMSPGVWITEVYFSGAVAPMEYLYQVESASQQLGFSLNRITMDLLVLLGIGTAYRVIAFVLLLFVKRIK